jgi:hypothetical protein
MTLLNQIVAIEKGVKSAAERELTEAHRATQRDALFSGLSRTYDPKDDEGEPLPPESTRVQQTVEAILDSVVRSQTRLFDVVLTKEGANTHAEGEVIVDGRVLLENVPVTYLLFLEKRLVDLRTFVAKLPLLDPAESWEHDTASGVWRSEPVKSIRNKKVPRAFVKAPATDKFPAQVDTYTEDIPVGTWTLLKFSGRIPADRQTELLRRVDALANAVKMAREQANTVTVNDRQAGALVFDYLFGV